MPYQKIILGVTGGIAANKAPELVRRLKGRGADVQVVMTRSAHEFVTETTLQAVSGVPVRSSLWDTQAEAAMGHIELARWADLVLIAPATAEIMSRLASGSAPDLLTTLCLATEAPIAIAPAMNHVMWLNPVVQENRQKLVDRGIRVLGPATGDQACGEVGPGRMLEPEDIVAALSGPIAAPVEVTDADPGRLSGKTVMITGGPTREAIDPVRYISNRSSGKMAFALAAAARQAGAKVLLVAGPVNLATPEGVERIDIESAKEMFAATHDRIDVVDIFIGAAAVADYYPAEERAGKIKKSMDQLSIDLVRNPDILSSVARLHNGPFTVGFAAETENLGDFAREKLEKKKLNMIVANLVGKGRGFEADDNAVEVFWRNGRKSFPLEEKRQLAHDLIALIAEHYIQSFSSDTQTELPAIMVRD